MEIISVLFVFLCNLQLKSCIATTIRSSVRTMAHVSLPVEEGTTPLPVTAPLTGLADCVKVRDLTINKRKIVADPGFPTECASSKGWGGNLFRNWTERGARVPSALPGSAKGKSGSQPFLPQSNKPMLIEVLINPASLS